MNDFSAWSQHIKSLADKVIVLGLSGRGDKDVHTVAKAMGQRL